VRKRCGIDASENTYLHGHRGAQRCQGNEHHLSPKRRSIRRNLGEILSDQCSSSKTEGRSDLIHGGAGLWGEGWGRGGGGEWGTRSRAGAWPAGRALARTGERRISRARARDTASPLSPSPPAPPSPLTLHRDSYTTSVSFFHTILTPPKTVWIGCVHQVVGICLYIAGGNGLHGGSAEGTAGCRRAG
jgi:hypothetical protein